jgi:hypothetical protein
MSLPSPGSITSSGSTRAISLSIIAPNRNGIRIRGED